MTPCVIKCCVSEHTKLYVVSVLWQMHLKLINYISDYSLQFNSSSLPMWCFIWLPLLAFDTVLLSYFTQFCISLSYKTESSRAITVYSSSLNFWYLAQCMGWLGKVIKKMRPWFDPWARPRQLEGPHFLPCAWNAHSAFLPGARSCPKSQPWGNNVVMRLFGWGTWRNIVKASCVHDWSQLRPLCNILRFGWWVQKLLFLQPPKRRLGSRFPCLFNLPPTNLV